MDGVADGVRLLLVVSEGEVLLLGVMEAVTDVVLV